MAKSTGPILAAGAITITNQSIFNDKPLNFRVVVATGLTVAVFSFIENAIPELAVGAAWIALLTVTLSRVDPSIPSPAESFLTWWEK